MLEAKYTEISDYGELRYYQGGQGKTIVFLHGYPDNLQVWGPLIKRLEKDYEVLAFDWPGMGGSATWKGGTAPSQMAARLLVILDHFEKNKVHLVAHDMGGQPALVAAGSFPDRIQSTCVMNVLAMHDAPTSWEIRILRNLTLNKWILTWLPRLVFFRVLTTFQLSGNSLTAEIKEDFKSHFYRPSVRQYIVRMCYGYQAQLPRLPKYYEKIACPLLILWSEKARHFSPENGKRLQQMVPGSQFETFAGAAHWMGLSEPDRIAQRLRKFWEDRP